MSFVRALKAAFLAPANLVGLGTAAGAAAYTGQPMPALVALGAEVFYLGLATAHPRFRRAVAFHASDEPLVTLGKEAEALLDELAASQREHYFALRDLKDRILANYGKLPGGKVLVASSAHRVDSLLIAFLRLLSTLNSYRKYMNATDRKSIEVELGELVADAASEQNPRLKEVKDKRIEILQKRVQRFAQAAEGREVVSHQLAGIEDLLRLTHEQSIAIRDPESITRQLDALSVEVQETEETVRELEQFMELSDELAPRIPQGTKVR